LVIGITNYSIIFVKDLNINIMNDYIVETENIDKYQIDIIQDSDPESPREWDNLGKMVCFHSSYNLGDKHDYNHNNYNGWDEMEKDIIRNENVGVILPLYLYDHSGITMNTTGFSCRWDSGQVGFIFISKEKIREEFGHKYVTQKVRDRVEKLLVGEVQTYDQYLTGDVYGYRITDTETDEELDSCWGFYGQEYCMTEAKRIVDYYLEKQLIVSNSETI
jgi:hypothetical protein